MTKLVTIFLSLVLSINCYSQVCIPDSIASKVIDELLVKDHLVFKVEKQDSVITVLYKSLEGKDEKIEIYKTNEEEYKTITAKLEEIIKLREAKIKDLEKQVRKINFKGIALTVVVAVETAVIAVLVIMLASK
jgi:hypothetical protein